MHFISISILIIICSLSVIGSKELGGEKLRL